VLERGECALRVLLWWSVQEPHEMLQLLGCWVSNWHVFGWLLRCLAFTSDDVTMDIRQRCVCGGRQETVEGRM
jgi:hypothetical protein